MMPGWAQSEGLLIEINAAEDLGVGINYVESTGKFISLTQEQSVEVHRSIWGRPSSNSSQGERQKFALTKQAITQRYIPVASTENDLEQVVFVSI